LIHGAGVAAVFATCGWLYSSTRYSIATIMRGARLVMRMELRPKGTLKLFLPIMARFMHKQEERNLAAIKEALEGPGARRGA
jgi:hypothetical protein